MGILRNPRYASELAYRTMLNYYRQILQFNCVGNKNEIELKIEQIEETMRARGYEVEKYYEVTALLNSLVGLLIILEQNAFNHISQNESDLETIFPTLYKCVNSGDYYNTYSGQGGMRSPRALILHIKNSLSHDRIMIFPQDRRTDNRQTIDSIVFQDAKVFRGNSRSARNRSNFENYYGDVREYVPENDERFVYFSLKISVEDLECCFMEIAHYLIQVGGV